MTLASAWTVAALTAPALVLAVAFYIAMRWRRAPAAFRAMKAVAGLCFVAGFLAGAWVVHRVGSPTANPSAALSPAARSAPSAPVGSVAASEVEKAIVETGQKSSGETWWLGVNVRAEGCNLGMMPGNTVYCRAAYLARHAEGKDLERGPQGDSVSLSDVADFCDAGEINKSSDLCVRAYAARHAGMK